MYFKTLAAVTVFLVVAFLIALEGCLPLFKEKLRTRYYCSQPNQIKLVIQLYEICINSKPADYQQFCLEDSLDAVCEVVR